MFDSTPNAPELSIVIPAFNEEQRLPSTLKSIAAFLSGRRARAEVIVVDDGSADGTARLVDGLRCQWPELRLLSNPGNRGKGYAVRHGMLAARGALILFSDADLAAPIHEIDKLIAAVLGGADIAIGSRCRRELIQAHQSAFREFAGRTFNRLLGFVLGLPFRDTQCGFKLFRREAAAQIVPLQRIERWAFDPELLYIAQRFGLRIAEVPVVWSHVPGTKIHVFRDSLRMFAEVVQVRWNAFTGKYCQANPSKLARPHAA
jgi:glycosyltransferase involved in cell wall biosynthesis